MTNDYYNQMVKNAADHNRQLAAKSRQYPKNPPTSYDPTMHLAQEFVTVAHNNNKAKATLVKNVDNGSKDYQKKWLNFYNPNQHALLICLPLTSRQYRLIQKKSSQWR